MKKHILIFFLTLLSLHTLKGYSQCWFSSSAGENHTIATRSDTTLWTWGANESGQLGDGTTIDKTQPTQIGTSNGWWEVAGGLAHSIARRSDGTIWTWGDNSHGQLGDGTTTDKLIPTQLGTATNWQNVFAGGNCTFALKTDGTLWAWGENTTGALGDGTTTERHLPVLVLGNTSIHWVFVACSGQHTIANKADGTLWGWGKNNYGQVGDGSTTDRITPVQIGSLNVWWQVAAGSYHSVAIGSSGASVYTWGLNDKGQLGDGTNTNKSVPTPLIGYTGFQDIGAGGKHTIGIANHIGDFLSIYNWGENTFGQLGNGTYTDSNTPVEISPNNYWYEVAAGNSHSLVLDSDNHLVSFGLNNHGQLGSGNITNRAVPKEVSCFTLDVTDNDTSTIYNLYPNPAKNEFTISKSGIVEESFEFSIIDYLGRVIKTGKAVFDEKVNIESLSSGNYILQLRVRENQTQNLKWVKQ